MAALTSLAALGALAGCFQVPQIGDCQLLCTASGPACPGGMICQAQPQGSYGLCAAQNAPQCPSLTPEAGTGPMDAGLDAGPDAEAGVPLPPHQLCHNGTCFALSDSVRANLALLLWPDNLPAVGSPVSVWSDQSGRGNDAHALYPAALPHVIADGVQLDAAQLGSGFVVPNSASLDFGAGDFALIMVSGLSGTQNALSFIKKSDGARTNSRQVKIDWVLSSSAGGRPQGTIDDTQILGPSDVPQPFLAAYGLYRAGDHVELHMNASVLGSADLPTPGLSTSNPEDMYVGVGSISAPPVDSIEAVIAIRGSVTSSDLNQLELFLSTVFAVGPRS